MRDENKRTYYVARPVKQSDTYNMTHISEYAPTGEYADLVTDGTERSITEPFGNRFTGNVMIMHDDNDGETPNIQIGDGVWLDEKDADYPPFSVIAAQKFGGWHVYTLQRTVDKR